MSRRSGSTPECGAAEPALPLEPSGPESAPFCSPGHRTDAGRQGRPPAEAAEGNLRRCGTPGCTSRHVRPAADWAFSPPAGMDAAAGASLWAKVSGAGGSSSTTRNQLTLDAQKPGSGMAVSVSRPGSLGSGSTSSSATPGLQQSRSGIRAPGLRQPPCPSSSSLPAAGGTVMDEGVGN